MRKKRKVLFWMDPDQQCLYVQNRSTGEIKAIAHKGQIVWFLNANHLTWDKLEGVEEGFDALNLFEDRDRVNLLPTLKEVRK